MDDGRRRTGPAPWHEAPVLHRCIADPREGNGYGNDSPTGATSATAARRQLRFRRAAHPDPAPVWPRSAERYKDAPALQTVARTDQLRRADRDTSPPPCR